MDYLVRNFASDTGKKGMVLIMADSWVEKFRMWLYRMWVDYIAYYTLHKCEGAWVTRLEDWVYEMLVGDLED